MNMSKDEKELLYQEFLERLKSDDGINTKTDAYRSLHNLERARNHFKQRAEALREEFEYELWGREGLNWNDWSNQICKMICHVYGVCIISKLREEELEEANDFAIKIIDELFDENVKHLKRVKAQQ